MYQIRLAYVEILELFKRTPKLAAAVQQVGALPNPKPHAHPHPNPEPNPDPHLDSDPNPDPKPDPSPNAVQGKLHFEPEMQGGLTSAAPGETLRPARFYHVG